MQASASKTTQRHACEGCPSPNGDYFHAPTGRYLCGICLVLVKKVASKAPAGVG